VALLLAEQVGGEIISVDSMQVYSGLDIGTAKPTSADRVRVPHHLLDVATLTEPFDAARFCTLAQTAVAAIQSRGGVPIFCGGTGLYFKALLEGLGDAPAPDPGLRRELEGTPLEALARELAERDPETFARIDRQNPRRLIRAVEVIRLTGKPFSAQRAAWQGDLRGAQASPPFFVLTRAKADLDRRVSVRVDAMFAQGLVTETDGLLRRGLAENPTAMQAIGYRQVVEHLRGERSLPETIELVKIKTRQYAKRQLTWFRRHATAVWLELNPDEAAAETAQRLLVALKSGQVTHLKPFMNS
jgi:tRNA dimethylallyltransferase